MRYLTLLILIIVLRPVLSEAQNSDMKTISPFVSYINARVDGENVILTWSDAEDTAGNVIYEIRRYQDAINTENLDKTELVAHVAQGIRTYTDKPDKDSPLWYAVITIQDGKSVNFVIPWRNTLGIPVKLSDGLSTNENQLENPNHLNDDQYELPRTEQVRPFPLPQLKGKTFPEKRELSSAASYALSLILNPVQGKLWEAPKSEILAADITDNNGSSQSALKKIINGPFARGNWQEAEKELKILSATENPEGNIRARIQFYMGECQYFQNNLNGAFLSFLVSSDYYYSESRRWMLRIYKELTPVS